MTIMIKIFSLHGGLFPNFDFFGHFLTSLLARANTVCQQVQQRQFWMNVGSNLELMTLPLVK